MPTVIILDISYSMSRIVGVEKNTILQLAIYGINCFLDYLAAHCKLEFVSLVVFSSGYKSISNFTRDYGSLRDRLAGLEDGGTADRTRLENCLREVNALVANEWGNTTACNIVLFTDGCLGEPRVLSSAVAPPGTPAAPPPPVPFPHPSRLHVLCVCRPDDQYYMQAKTAYIGLLAKSGAAEPSAALYSCCPPLPNNANNNNSTATAAAADSHQSGGGCPPLDKSAVKDMVARMAETNYREFRATLRCGRLQCRVVVCPPPEPYVEVTEHHTARHLVGDTLEICGFLSAADVGSPMAHSRHLLLPAANNDDDSQNNNSGEDAATPGGDATAGKTASKSADASPSVRLEEMQVDEDPTCSASADEGRQPSFCVLLHGALRKEGMVALVSLDRGCAVGGASASASGGAGVGVGCWYGFAYSCADNRKRSNLMLMTLPPGHRPLPWLGDFRCLGTKDQVAAAAAATGTTAGAGAAEVTPPAFPVRPVEKRSYSQSTVTWIKHAGLQSDIQKILRHARKLPEKTSHFYKELNRIRRAAISLGFLELLDALAEIFQRECSLLPPSANPDCALQLSHAAQELKRPQNRELLSAATSAATAVIQQQPQQQQSPSSSLGGGGNITPVSTKYNLNARV